MKKWITIAGTAALLFAVAAYAGENGDEGKKPGDWGPPGKRQGQESFVGQRLVDRLALTDAQKAQLETLRAEFKQKRESWMEAHRAEGQALHEEMRAARDAKDQAKTTETLGKMRQHSEPMRALRHEYVQKFRATLNADQQKTLDEAMDRARDRMEERRGEGEGPGHGPGPGKGPGFGKPPGDDNEKD